ncbi:CBS domain-containing protein [Roseomonas xinghualingensis]|uniref:CBS domain-containing protein n=1 Tax=Roseomonas xinghualingensis TaxID=2986475 RepID=UPI0021F1A9BA|nr:CBS domain-containing protein [Roseomonas sp. SXEYE001]MCV4206481.1 CBS domain-containing protein [Roseomonas sp. SXEYE001]
MSTPTKETLFARDLMSREVASIPASMPIASIARLLAERGLSAVTVTSADGKLLGIVTELDLIRRLGGTGEGRVRWLQRLLHSRDRDAERYAQLHGAVAEDVMTRDVVTVSEDTTADQIVRLMEEKGIRRVPVLRNGDLVGMVSRADLLQALITPPPSGGSEEAQDERIREAVWKEIREQPWADAFYTFVEVREGVVEFHGFARSEAVRRGLQAIAHQVPGVKGVRDSMEDVIPGGALY